MAHGCMANYMDMENYHGMMAGLTRANSGRTKNMAWARWKFQGPMAKLPFWMANGNVANWTDKPIFGLPMVTFTMDWLKMVNLMDKV